MARFSEYRPKFAEYVVDGMAFLKDARDRGMNITVEGADVGQLVSLLGFDTDCLVG